MRRPALKSDVGYFVCCKLLILLLSYALSPCAQQLPPQWTGTHVQAASWASWGEWVSNGAHSVIFSTSIKLNKLFYCAEPPPMLTVTLPDRNWLLLREKADSHPYCRFTRHILYMQFITCFNISKTIFYNLIWDYFEIYRAQWNSCNNYVKKG